jgi:hypothetical protein
MSNPSLQFFALPEELSTILHGSLDGLTLLGEFDNQVHMIPIEWSLACLTNPHLKEVAFTPQKVTATAASIEELRQTNPEVLVLEIGHLTTNGLKESWLWSMCNDPVASKRWNSVAAKIRRHTKSGMRAVNPRTGGVAEQKSLRFTRGAQIAYHSGTPLLSFVGFAILQPPPLEP